MKTTVELPDELFIQAKKHAAEHRTTIKALIETGLKRQLHSGEVDTKPRAIKWVTVPGPLPEGMDVADRASMLGHLLARRTRQRSK